MADMYVWKVELEVEWEYVTKAKSGGKSRSIKEIDQDVSFTVAAPTGLKAIEVTKKVALEKDRGYVDDWSDENETITAKPVRVVDVTGLELVDTLDG